MTESEWLAGNDALPLWDFVRARIGDRKGRLFAAACCRRVLPVLQEGRYGMHVETCERYADGLATAEELESARTGWPWGFSLDPGENGCEPDDLTWLAPDRNAEVAIQAKLLREIVGNPFRSVRLAQEWLSANDALVASLARTIYDERAFDRMPILGDALEDAGCADLVILDHCRGASGHVRGCWLLDLILGRE